MGKNNYKKMKDEKEGKRILYEQFSLNHFLLRRKTSSPDKFDIVTINLMKNQAH